MYGASCELTMSGERNPDRRFRGAGREERLQLPHEPGACAGEIKMRTPPAPISKSVHLVGGERIIRVEELAFDPVHEGDGLAACTDGETVQQSSAGLELHLRAGGEVEERIGVHQSPSPEELGVVSAGRGGRCRHEESQRRRAPGEHAGSGEPTLTLLSDCGSHC